MKHKKISTILSVVCMGLGQFYNKSFVKGILFLLVGISFVLNIGNYTSGVWGIFTLGETPQSSVGFDVVQGDHSIFLLLEGLIKTILLIATLTVYVYNIIDAKKLGQMRDEGHLKTTFKETLLKFYNENFVKIMLTPAALGTIFFIILPILATTLIAFTNYSAPNHLPPRNLVDWVGFENFRNIIKLKSWSYTFGKLLLWTGIWAIASTFLNYVVGLGLALLTNKKGIKLKGMWRTIYILPYAMPAFISLLVFRLMFNGIGPINNMLVNLGIERIPFFTDPILAKISVLAINTWVGAPYFMVLLSGSLTNISSTLYEAAEIDGATKMQQFKHITLPMLLFQTAPVLILSFAYNFNNFGAIYLLTDGNPVNSNLKFAGETDILVTWLYKLTVNQQQFGMAAVISIVLFAFIATVSLYNFRKSKSFTEEDMI